MAMESHQVRRKIYHFWMFYNRATIVGIRIHFKILVLLYFSKTPIRLYNMLKNKMSFDFFGVFWVTLNKTKIIVIVNYELAWCYFNCMQLKLKKNQPFTFLGEPGQYNFPANQGLLSFQDCKGT